MNRPSEPSAPAPGGDPWAAVGYLVAGVAFYGFIGWGVSVWLHANYWIPIGILVGAGFGMYLVYARYRVTDSDDHQPRSDRSTRSAATTADPAAQAGSPASGTTDDASATPDGATPDGATPDGATPDGATPDNATPSDAARARRPDSDDRGETA